MAIDRQLGAEVTRRGFIRVALGGAVLVPGLLAACSAPAPTTSPTAAAGAAAAKPGSALPTFVPLQGGP
jgi:hypothetical protein